MDNKSRRLNPARAAIAGLALAALPMASFAFVSVGVSITVAPPALPVYVQPPPTQAYWYYCQSAQAYYPYVSSCPEPWIPVPAAQQ